MSTATLSLANRLSDPNVRTIRCGIVPYTFKNGKLYFLLGRDKATGDLGDFGGGIKKDERALVGGWREFMQETKGIFRGEYGGVNTLSNKLALITPQMSVIFVPLACEWLTQAPLLFSSKVCSDKQYNEMSEIVWLEEGAFRYHVLSPSSREIWKKVKVFFKDHYMSRRDMRNWLHNIYLS